MRDFWARSWGPFRVARVVTQRGDGKCWTTYMFQYKPNRLVTAGPDKLSIRFETKIREKP